MGRSRCWLAGLVAAAGLTFSSGAVYAGALPVPVNVAPVAATPAGLQSVVTFDARGVGGAANAGYYSRPVLISNNTLSGLANGLARRVAPVAAFTAAVAAAGWAIDELSKQVQTPGTPGVELPAGATVWVFRQTLYPSQDAAGSAVISAHNSEIPDWAGFTVSWQDLGGGTWYARVGTQNSAYVVSTQVLPEPAIVGAIAPQPVSSPQLADLIKDNPQLWNDALRNPDGSVNRNPDVQGEAQRLADELLDPNASPQPDPTAEWDTGRQGGAPQNSPTALDFPTFCTWASKVCEFVDWMRQEQEPEADPPLPEVDPVIPPSTWVSGLGGGSCPQNPTFAYEGQEFEFSMEPICDFAGVARYFVIAAASFMGLMIVTGYRRRA